MYIKENHTTTEHIKAPRVSILSKKHFKTRLLIKTPAFQVEDGPVQLSFRKLKGI